MDRIWSYINVEFLINHFNEDIKIIDDRHSAWYNLNEFFMNRCILLIDSHEKLEKQANENPLVKKLIKNSSSGGSEVIDIGDSFYMELRENFEENLNKCNSNNPLLFIEFEPNTNYNIGIEFITYSNKYEVINRLLMKRFSLSVSRRSEKNQLVNWKVLLGNLPRSNSLIIADNYLFRDDDYIKNLIDILSFFVTKDLEVTYEVLILIHPEELNFESKCLQLNERIKLFNSKIEISVVKSLYHSRALISNYLYIQSDHSFSVFNSKGKIKKDALISYIPICGELDLAWYNMKLGEINDAIKQNRGIFGSGTNRLLN